MVPVPSYSAVSAISAPVPTKYPAKTHAKNTLAHFLSLLATGKTSASLLSENITPEDVKSTPVFALTAPSLELYPHCDQTQPFRQDRYFNYFTGAHDLPGLAVLYFPATDKLILYLPPIDEDDVMWSGLPISIEQAKKLYDVDDVKYQKDMPEDLANVTGLVTIDDRNKDTLDKLVGNSSVKISPVFKEAIEEARLRKDSYEIMLMKKASEISDISHRAVMSALPIEQSEGHIHAEFVYHSMRQGSKFQSYDPICCSGTDCSTLHYVRNDQDLKYPDGEQKQLVLIDAGAEWQCYASDVTRVFPISGEWTKESLQIYNAVKEMQDECTKGVKPGVPWEDLHLLAHKILIKRFQEFGIFKSSIPADEILKRRTSVGFLPHGLGHLLGMDTHDVAGHPNYEDADSMFRYLRLRRVLEPGFVVTVEPGIYFNKLLLKDYLNNEKHLEVIDTDVLEKYWKVGGVRLEDDVLVTKDGYENFTQMIRDANKVSELVKQGISKGRDHFHVLA